MPFFGLIFLIVALILVGAGFAIGAGVFAVACMAVAFGMVSTSMASGILQRKLSTAFRVFFYELCIISFMTAGVALSWPLSAFLDLSISPVALLMIGSLSGLAVGLTFGLLHSWMIDLISRNLRKILPRITRPSRSHASLTYR
ncbi:MAG TPA: hypothetical protein VNB29_01045 [Chthoniobacterales bacterium]|nr:hypothetical protein [Chthoniobacterales bacterium]